MSSRRSRRTFLKRLAALSSTVLAAPCFVPASALGRDGRPPASERIAVAIIGTGNQGMNDCRDFLRDERVQVVAVCDVNREGPGYWNGGIAGREPARRMVEAHYAEATRAGTYRGCSAVADFREVLQRRDLDAVEVATPDHWHALLVTEAARAGLDIYGQKPLSLTIAEGRAMSDAVQRHGVVFQTGSQQRSDVNFRRACELVRNGRIGQVHTVRVGMPSGRPDLGKTADQKQTCPVPDGFDFDRWLGPAPRAEYCPARVGVNFRWIFDYSGGQVTDWGGHHPDCAQWGLGTELTGPVEIRQAKGVFPADPIYNTATEYYFEAIYADGTKMIISDKERSGVTWEGTTGKVYANRGQYETEPATLKDSVIGPNEIQLYRSDNHFRNFVDCVYSRQPTAAPIEVAHRSITICHLGNIAMRLGRDRLRWDPQREVILEDAEADALRSRPYRAPWQLNVS